MANMILGFVMDILIFWGTAMGAAMSATAADGKMELPSLAVALFALTVAVVQAGRRWDSKNSPKTDAVVVPPDIVRQVMYREAQKAPPEMTRAASDVDVTPKRADIARPKGD